MSALAAASSEKVNFTGEETRQMGHGDVVGREACSRDH
jgi:hypothetical protein